MSDSARAVRITKLHSEQTHLTEDLVAHEEPLELQVDGTSLAVVMRTPGHDEELGLGFLLTEGVVKSAADIESLRHCTTVPTPEAEDNVLQVRLRRPVDLARLKRHFFATSSCGVCGKATIDAALTVAQPIDSPVRITRAQLAKLPLELGTAQPTFAQTGGLHAAALFDEHGALRVAREDVGRHNAVDKVVGWAARSSFSTSQGVLLVSGRVSFELVQKAVAARVPVLAGVSAPTSLAVSMAHALGVTLVGFLRGDSMNVYAHPERIVESR
ncbi:MAG: formate dehydrogenase accessory sulfurtransferase FdhD [Myxococcaceae bacterium]